MPTKARKVDSCGVRLNSDAESETKKFQEELKVDVLMRMTEAAGGTVAEELLKDDENICDAETCSDAHREDADKERDASKRKMESEE